MPQLEIELRGHLLVAGGRTSALGVDQTTARRLVAGGWVPYIPATALRGAVRMQLEALLRGADMAGSAPYPFDGGEPAEALERALTQPPDDVVARLFGFSGPPGERTGSAEGCLRFGDALPVDGEQAVAAIGIRPGVELDDERLSAADRKLYFAEVAEVGEKPLVFLAALDVGGAAEEDLRLLRVAVETTEAIGAAKARGGGEVRVRWRDGGSPPAARVAGEVESATRARLEITLREPAHFGDGGPLGNHHGTRLFIPGATIRGAIAWALLRHGRTRPEEPGFHALFLDEARPASFGDALPVPDSGAAPIVRPATRRKVRGSGAIEDVLVLELARDRVNQVLAAAGSGHYLRLDDVSRRLEPLPAVASERLLRRTRTRVSIDRRRGAASDGKLFSIEQLEPQVPAGDGLTELRPVRFVSWIEDLRPDASRLLANLEGLPLLVGAGRNHGLGLAEVELRFLPAPDGGEARERVRALTEAVAKRAEELSRDVELALPSMEGRALLALVAQSPFVPGEEASHPLAVLAAEAGEPVRAFLARSACGGYDQRPANHRPEHRKPLKGLVTAVAAGSIFVYEVREEDLDDLLVRALPALRRGVGRRCESGCGRFALWVDQEAVREKGDGSEIDTKTRRQTMSVDKLAGLKTALVERAEAAADRVASQKGNASQLRNLLQISQSESEVAVLANFIRYQAARQATRRFWQDLHQPVIDDLEWIAAQTEKEGGAERRKSAIQHYLGFLIRRYVFLTEGRKDKGDGRGKGQARRSA